MRKRIQSLALALVLCLGLLPTAVLAADGFTITDGVLTEYNGPGGDVVIPQGVTAIGEKAFRYRSDVTSVTIPNGVTSIGNEAFRECSNLTNVTIPNSVTSIGSGTFCECRSLPSVTIPNSVTSIGDCAFYGCSGLTNLTLGNGLLDIPWEAFAGCTGLTSVTIPDSVTSIGGYRAFGNCTSLTSITLGKGLTHVDSDAFEGCTNLTSVTIPPELTQGPWGAPSLTTVCGAPGSWAELWAQDNGYTFVADRPYTTTPSITAYATPQTVYVDGKPVTFQCYAKKDEKGNLTNYVKLRDLAYVLNGTQAQFQVGYSNNRVTVTTKTPYTANGSEMSTPFSGNRTYLGGSGGLRVNDRSKNADSFVLRDDNGGGYTYYKLRDLGKLLGFNVGWSKTAGVYVETNKPYDSKS